MTLWRLSGSEYARSFDGGYGLRYDGRWNTRGSPVTYCATGPALCLLEKLVHIDEMPDDTMLVCYEVPDQLPVDDVSLNGLPRHWRRDESGTRAIGDKWLKRSSTCLLRVPSVIVPVAGSGDRNLLVNHRHPAAVRIRISSVERFDYDARLFG